MGLVNRTLEYIKIRRENVLAGNVYCIPSPLESFRTDFIGIEQETYFLVSGAQKSGKTKFTSFMFLYILNRTNLFSRKRPCQPFKMHKV